MAASAMALQVLPVKPARKGSHFLFSPALPFSSAKPLQLPRYPSISLCASANPPSPSPSTSSSRAASITSTRLYVSGLSFRTTEESLRAAFENFGQLTEVNLVMDKIANRPRGFAFLRYATEEESKKAIDGMHGKVQSLGTHLPPNKQTNSHHSNMGICGSTASWENQDQLKPALHRRAINTNVAIYLNNGGHPRLGSLHSHQGTKGLNQDAAILHQGYQVVDGAFCGVFDGHGKYGHVVSEAARNRLPELLLNQKEALSLGKLQDDGLQWKQALGSAFSAMDKEIKLLENVDCSLSGTTAVVVVKQGDDLFIANLGDSRAIIGTATEKVIKCRQLTTDLKPGLPDEADRIKKSNGRVFALVEEPHIQRVWMPEENYPGLAMSRSFGDFDLKKHGIISTPELSHHRVSPEDKFIVLATDGVWDVLNNEQVAAIVWGACSEAEAAKEVVTEALKAWKRRFPSAKVDDCTALCLFFNGNSGGGA